MPSPIRVHETYTFEPPATAVRLKGFVREGVTYESHTFFVDFGKAGSRTGPDATLYVRHGGGWESLNVRHMTSMALKSLLDAGDTTSAFFLCWELFEQVGNAFTAGARDASERFRKAFIDGRLKKRKLRNREAAQVWIEPEPGRSTGADKFVIQAPPVTA